jgi:hypothetical protein
MHELVLLEILALPAERSRGRHNPRVVKRKMSGFPTKARAAPGPPPSQRFHYRDHVRIVAPAMAAAEPAMAAPKRPRPCEVRTDRHAFWLEHVRAWRASGLSRAGYAERHGLKLPSLHQWIARLRHIFHKRDKARAGRP